MQQHVFVDNECRFQNTRFAIAKWQSHCTATQFTKGQGAERQQSLNIKGLESTWPSRSNGKIAAMNIMAKLSLVQFAQMICTKGYFQIRGWADFIQE